MNICFFSGDITRSGGTEKVAVMIANELNKDLKYNVSFVSLTERKEETFFPLDKDIPRYILYKKESEGLLHFPGHIIRLRKVVKKYNIDVLIDIDGVIDMYSVPVKWLTGVIVISWEHFNYYYHPTPKLRNKVRKTFYKHLDAIVTLTEQDKENYKKELDLRCPVYAIYNPIENFGSDSIYDKESKTIISVGRLTYQKGFDRLVDLADEVLIPHPDWEWHIYGEGEDREALQTSIKEKGLSNQLKLMGNVSDMDKRYRESAMFVMTSRFEGLPMTLLEAKEYKLPIVSYDIETGPREFIIDGKNGYLIKENDKSEMIKKINNYKRVEFSEKALDDTNKFELNSIINKWNDMFYNLNSKEHR